MNEEALESSLIGNEMNNNPEIEYAGIWPRFKAAFIDGFVTLPLGGLMMYNLFMIKSFPLMCFTTLLTILYKPLMEWRYGATVGKMVLQLKVVNEEHQLLTIDQAFGRSLPWIINHVLSLISYFYLFQTDAFYEMTSLSNMDAITVSTPIETTSTIYFYIFLVMVGSLIYDKRKQGIHDKIAKTVVIINTKKVKLTIP
jgi:uncharacterized RDD family membrane protein YckC